MIITIDGPAGAGKSSVSKMLAKRLGFQFLDTGAMYRAVTWAALQRGIPLSDQNALGRLAAELEIAFLGTSVLVNGRDVTEEIRSPKVTQNVVAIADTPLVRKHLVHLQREIAKHENYVCEGRDQGSVVFPGAVCKFYLTASAEQRAKRRVDQLRQAGQAADLQEIIDQQNRRDQQDFQRPVGRLAKADGAIEIDTDHKTIGEVVDELEMIALLRIRQLAAVTRQ
jgi:cytidylate kinase